MNLRHALAILLLILIGTTLTTVSSHGESRSYLEVSPSGRDDLNALITTLEGLLDEGLPMEDPVVVVLHGSEANSFTSRGYQENRGLVDRAARLSAYRLIEVRMCETWMTENGVQSNDLPAFVDTVPYAPEEIERLETEGYLPWGQLDI